MIEQLITYLTGYIKTGQPSSVTVHGLAHRLRRIEDGKGKEFPAIYCANDEYHNIEHDTPFLYIRQRAAISESESYDNAPSGCDDSITRVYPMTLVGYMPKNIYNKDNAYSDETISGNIANTIDVLSWKIAIKALGLSDINLNIRNIDTDRWSVWAKEYKEIPMAARLDHAYFSIDFDLSVTAVQSCLRNYECGDTPVSPNACSNLKSTAILRDTDDVVISVTVIPAGETADITAPDGVVKNSTETFSLNVKSGGLETLPNPNLSFNGSVQGQIVSQEPVLVTLTDGTNPITPDSVGLVGNTLGITILPPFFSFEEEYRRVLLTAQANGITLPSAPVRSLENQLMGAAVTSGQYALADVLYIFAHDAPIAFGCINWKNPLQFNMTMYAGMTQIANQGVKGDGIAGYGDTNFNPSLDGVNYTLNNASRYYYLFDSVAQPNNFIDGTATAANRMILTSAINNQINGGTLAAMYDYTLNREMKSIHRVDAANINLFRDKNVTARANASTALSTNRQWLNRATNQYSQNTCSMYMMGADMTAINDDVVDDFAAYINAL